MRDIYDKRKLDNDLGKHRIIAKKEKSLKNCYSDSLLTRQCARGNVRYVRPGRSGALQEIYCKKKGDKNGR